MSTSKLDTSGVFDPVKVDACETHLSLPAEAVRFHRNGMVFPCNKPIPVWTEMTVELHSPRNGKRIRCTGVVVTCQGDEPRGYSVAMVFLHLSPQSARALTTLAYA